MKKEIIMACFDKASGYGEAYGDFADYEEIGTIRDEFIRLVDEVIKIEGKSILSCLSENALKLIDEEIKNEA